MLQKKYILVGILSMICTFSTFANENGGWYNTPITTEKLHFTAVLNGSQVDMKWSRFDSFSDEGLQYYKVVRSSKNANPVYPDDGYIKFDPNMDFTSYTDKEPEKWVNYYRVCAITSEMNRYCSNVVKIDFKKSSEKPKNIQVPSIDKPNIWMANPASVNCTKLWGTLSMKEEVNGQVGYCTFPNGKVCEEWKLYRGECSPNDTKKDDVLTKKIDELVAKFEKKLNEIYGNDPEKKADIINNAIENLETLKVKKPNFWNVIDMVIERLQKISDLSDIENILNFE